MSLAECYLVNFRLSLKCVFYLFFFAGGSRRQSNAFRSEMESTYSLQGSFIGARDSPRPILRRLDRIPFYKNEESRATLERPTEEIKESLETSEHPAHPSSGPNQLLRSVVSSSIYPGFHKRNNLLRESRSLDPFPSQNRKSNDVNQIIDKLKKKSSVSLEQGVSIISSDPNGNSQNHTQQQIINNSFRLSNNNCNGSANIEDPSCPLLHRQTSLTTEHDAAQSCMHVKKWRSLEARMDEDNQSSASGTKGSIKSWIKGIFQSNGFKNSNSSLKKVSIMQGVKEVPVIEDVEPSTEKETIV